MEGIKAIFQTRDEAVSDKDYKKFASTQLDNISNASISGYLSSKKLKTEVLHIAEDTELKRVVFVKENYGIHSAFLLYYLVNSINGWKIYNIISSIQ